MKSPSPRTSVSRRGFLRAGFSSLVAGAAAAVTTRRSAQAADRGSNPFAYDVGKYRRTDPELIGYERVRRFKAPVARPRRIAIDGQDRLYLAAGKTISVMDGAGGPLSKIAASGPVRSLTVADDGTLYVGIRDHVELYNPQGERLKVWDKPEGKPFLTGLALSENELFVADAGNRMILRYDRSGQFKGRLATKDRDRGIPGLVIPSPYLDVEMGADGLLRVNNPGRHRVEVYTVEGDLEFFWGKPSMAIKGFCGCCNPVNIALLPDGRCVTFEKGLPRVKVYGPLGDFETVVAGPESFADSGDKQSIMDADESTYGGLDGVIDSRGEIYVLDLLAGDVQVMREKGDGA